MMMKELAYRNNYKNNQNRRRYVMTIPLCSNSTARHHQPSKKIFGIKKEKEYTYTIYYI